MWQVLCPSVAMEEAVVHGVIEEILNTTRVQIYVSLEVISEARGIGPASKDAPKILIHVGASEAKRSEAVVWGLLGSFSSYISPNSSCLVLLSFLFVACSCRLSRMLPDALEMLPKFSFMW